MRSVTATGGKKTAKAICVCSERPQDENFSISVNKVPFNVLVDDLMISKLQDIITVLKEQVFRGLNFSITVSGGGQVSKIYAARQAFAKSLIAYYGKYLDEFTKQEMKNKLLKFDKLSLVSDPRRAEPKKYGGPGARARYQKSYR
jgi:small subunit ribosomal protein S16e